jgi:threonine dehydrogenase-like Zn-dependent dehydrogenase
MKALVFKDVGQLQLEKLPVPQITRSDQVLIKVSMCGICGSDVKILQGKHAYKQNVVLGHEFNGKVVDVGDGVTTLKAGDRISIDNNPRCGLCEYCRTGISSQCESIKENTIGIYKNGGYAEYCIVQENVCFKLPDEIDDVVATQVETLGTVLNGMNTVQMQAWDSVLILGYGPIGYLFTALASNIAAQVAVTEIDPFRYKLAESLGVPTFNPYKDDLEESVIRITNGKKFNIVIDAVGTQLETALNCVASGGKILAFGMDDSFKATISPYQVTRRAIKILGTYIGQNTCLPAIKILEAHKINLDNFFTDTISLEEGPAAFARVGFDLDGGKEVPKCAMKLILRP